MSLIVLLCGHGFHGFLSLCHFLFFQSQHLLLTFFSDDGPKGLVFAHWYLLRVGLLCVANSRSPLKLEIRISSCPQENCLMPLCCSSRQWCQTARCFMDHCLEHSTSFMFGPICFSSSSSFSLHGMVMVSFEHEEVSSFVLDKVSSILSEWKKERVFGWYRSPPLGIRVVCVNGGQRATLPSVILRNAIYLHGAWVAKEL